MIGIVTWYDPNPYYGEQCVIEFRDLDDEYLGSRSIVRRIDRPEMTREEFAREFAKGEPYIGEPQKCFIIGLPGPPPTEEELEFIRILGQHIKEERERAGNQ